MYVFIAYYVTELEIYSQTQGKKETKNVIVIMEQKINKKKK